jgi:hypothetical protein
MSTFSGDSDATSRAIKRAAYRRQLRRLRWVQIVSLIIAFVAAVFIWWTIGLSIDAADSFTSEPPVAHWTGTAIIIFVLSMLTVVGVEIVAVLRSKK